MKIRQNLIISNKENHPILPKDISRKSIPISADNNRRVLTQQNQRTVAQGKLERIDQKQNLVNKKFKCSGPQERKTIENTIKDMLKGKQDLFNYLESEKEFISILDNHDINLKNLAKQRGKLASSLTEKKKSRTDTYSGTNKSRMNSNFKKFGEYLIQYHKTSNTKIQNSSVTVQVVNNREKTSQQQQQESCEIESKHYETISFDKITTEINEIPNKQIIKSSLTEENEHPKYCLVLTSPNKKKPKKIGIKTYGHQHNFYSTKYGLTNFSPWGFSKDIKHNDFDMIEMESHDNSFDNEKMLKTSGCKIQSGNQNENLRKVQFLSQSIQSKRKISTRSQNKSIIQKNQYILAVNEKYDKKEPQKEHESVKNRKQEEKFQESDYIESSLKQVNVSKISESNRNKANHSIKKQDPVNILKSSQVIILNNHPGKISEMFAPKSSIKHHVNPKRSFNKDFPFVKNDIKAFHTEVSEENVENRKKMKTIEHQNENLIQKESELIEMKKTEEFLKQIIINKNNMIYANQNLQQKTKNNQRTISKSNSNEQNETKLKSISAKHSKEMNFKTYNHLKSECIFLETQINFGNEKTKCTETDKQNVSSYGQEILQKKAKTSLGKPLHENEVYQLISSSNTKNMTEANLSGFYMINDSKIRNEKNAFVRKKRHSAMLTKNRKHSQSMHNREDDEKRKYSFSVDKKDVLSRSDLSLLQQGKGFGIINPLTKQLYKKYVSILQHQKRI